MSVEDDFLDFFRVLKRYGFGGNYSSLKSYFLIFSYIVSIEMSIVTIFSYIVSIEMSIVTIFSYIVSIEMSIVTIFSYIVSIEMSIVTIFSYIVSIEMSIVGLHPTWRHNERLRPVPALHEVDSLPAGPSDQWP